MNTDSEAESYGDSDNYVPENTEARGADDIESPFEEEEDNEQESEADQEVLDSEGTAPDNRHYLEYESSAAFQSLDQLLHSGEISALKVNYLKQRYTHLADTLKKMTEQEAQNKILIELYDNQNRELLSQQQECESVSLKPAPKDSVIRKRRRLLVRRNELSLSIERTHYLKSLNDKLLEDKEVLEVEYDMYLQSEAARNIFGEIERMQTLNSDLRKEIVQKQSNIEALNDRLEALKHHILTRTQDNHKLQNEKNLLTIDAIEAKVAPADLTKKNERLERKILAQKKLSSKTEVQYQEIYLQSVSLKEKCDALRAENQNLLRDLSQKKEDTTQLEYKLIDLEIRTEQEHNEEIKLTETRAFLSLSIDNLRQERRMLRENNRRIAAEVEQNLKEIRAEEASIKALEVSKDPLKRILQKLTRQLEAMSLMKDRDELLERKRLLQKEVTGYLKSVAAQESLSEEARMSIELILAKRRQQEAQMESRSQQLHELVKHHAATNQFIERQSIKYRKLLLECRQLMATASVREYQIIGMQNTVRLRQKRSSDLEKLNDVIRIQSRKLLNLGYSIRQKILQMTERKRMLDSDVKVLTEKALVLRSLLENTISRKQIATGYCIRLRDMRIAKRHKLEVLSDTLKECQLRVSHLKHIIRRKKSQMDNMRTRLKAVAGSRNKKGFELVELDEEVAVLYDRVNLQGTVIDNTQLTLRQKTDELSSEKVKLLDEQRSHKILCETVEQHDWLAREYYRLSEELCKTKKRRILLEKLHGDTGNPLRVRFLRGLDPDALQIKVKSDLIQLRLTQKDLQLKERALINHRLDRMIKMTSNEIDSGKDVAHGMAIKVSHVRRSLRVVTRRMMASVAELSIYRAQELSLSDILQEQIKFLEEIHGRSSTEWQQTQSVGGKYGDRKQESDEEEDDDDCDDLYRTSYSYYERLTTNSEGAKQSGASIGFGGRRPDSYLPDPYEVCLPRPYGAHAPFKPAKPSHKVKCFRKFSHHL